MSEEYLRRVWPALLVALVSIIAGGLLSAITAHAATRSASWAAAYLVLVAGVGTGGLAAGRALLSSPFPRPVRVWVEFVLWFAGNALVLAGTLLHPRWLVDVGGGLLVASLASVVAGVRRGAGPVAARRLFLTLVTVLLISVPVGLLLSHVR
ncbi:MAG TPA: hypothetical protein VK098_11085 [Beutenbergiaceae bacterium]|nr:hypothetical protein [Beutenbergiaceae bacterium]